MHFSKNISDLLRMLNCIYISNMITTCIAEKAQYSENG